VRGQKIIALATCSHSPSTRRRLALALMAYILALVIAVVALATTVFAGFHSPDKVFGVAAVAVFVLVDAVVL
jgi:membrane protein YdbS with pleckstrin-like domain